MRVTGWPPSNQRRDDPVRTDIGKVENLNRSQLDDLGHRGKDFTVPREPWCTGCCHLRLSYRSFYIGERMALSTQKCMTEGFIYLIQKRWKKSPVYIRDIVCR